MHTLTTSEIDCVNGGKCFEGLPTFVCTTLGAIAAVPVSFAVLKTQVYLGSDTSTAVLSAIGAGTVTFVSGMVLGAYLEH